MIITVINNKGGTGKTTTSINLSAALAKAGSNILVVDMDSQASASLSLGISKSDLSPSTADVLFKKKEITEVIRSTAVTGLDIVTGEMALANTDLILANAAGREQRLSQGLMPVQDQYDFIICDCAPSLSMLAVNALWAADRYLVPVAPEYLALEGLVSLMKAVTQMKTGMNIHAQLLGILFTMVNPRLKISRNIIQLVRQHYGKEVFNSQIRRDVKLAESPSFSLSIFEYAPKSRGAMSYAALADEVLKRCENERQKTIRKERH